MTQIVTGSTVGLDLGDKRSYWVEVNAAGEIAGEGFVATRAAALSKLLGGRERLRVAVEAGSNSAWVSRLVRSMGHEAVVANPRQVPLITRNRRKSDRLDAETLARLARLDPELLKPIRHRGEEAQRDLALLRGRDSLVKARTQLINAVRGTAKQHGKRLPSCGAEAFARRAAALVPAGLRPALGPLLAQIGQLTEQIRAMDRQVARLCRDKYPETGALLQIRGVGQLTALAFVLTLESPRRFASNRDAGPFLGLVPRRCQSGGSDPQLGISKTGDKTLRRLLVNCAQYILGPFGIDSDLRRHGEKIASRGGKSARKRAVVAVARKLSVLMLRLWRTGEVYEPLYNAARQAA